MALETRFQELLLTGGLDVKSHEQAEDPSGFSDLDGYRFGELGKLEKVPATTSIADGSDGDVHTLFERDGELAMISTRSGVRRVRSSDTAAIVASTAVGSNTSTRSIGVITPTEVARKFIASAQFTEQDEYIYSVTATETAAGDILVAWLVQYGGSGAWRIRVRVVDTSGVLVSDSDKHITPTSANPPILSSCKYDGGAILTYADTNTGPATIKAVQYTDSTGEFSTAVNLTTAAANTRHIVRYVGGTTFYFAYYANSDTFLRVETRSLGSVSSTHVATHTGLAIEIVQGATHTLIAVITSPSLTSITVEELGSPGTTTTVGSLGGSQSYVGLTGHVVPGTNQARLWASAADTNVDNEYFVNVVGVQFGGTLGALGTDFVVPNTIAASNAFANGSESYCPLWVGEDIDEFGSIVIARLNPAGGMVQPIARCVHDRSCGVASWALFSQNSAFFVGNTLHLFTTADLSSDGVPTTGSKMPQSLAWSTIKFASAVPPLAFAKHETSTLIASGMLHDYDGAIVSEAQPLNRPRIFSTPGSGTTFSVKAMYSWVDRAGNLHRSQPSESLLVDATDSVYVSIPPMYAWDPDYAPGGLNVEVYATAAGGSNYYLLNTSSKKDSWDSTSTGGMWYVFSSVAAGTTSDPPLYTDSGELASEPPPSFVSITKVGDRLFAVDAEDRRRWWCSKPFVAGYAPEWNTALTGFLADEAHAVVDLNGVPTFLCSDGCYQLYGEGPNAFGVGTFAPPRKISQLGCATRASVCETPVGILYQSDRGFVVLDSAGGIQEVGLPIEPLTNPRAFTPLRVIYDVANNEIRAIGASTTYAFSVANGAWTKQSNSTSNVDAVVIDGVVHRATASTILTELRRGDSGYNQHTGSATAETPWVSNDGIEGFGKLYALHLAMQTPSEALSSDITVTITLYADYDENTVISQWTYDSTKTTSWITSGVEWLRLRPAKQRLTSWKLKIEITGSLSHSGLVPLAVRQEYGYDPRGRRRMPSSRRSTAAQPTVTVTSP